MSDTFGGGFFESHPVVMQQCYASHVRWTRCW